MTRQVKKRGNKEPREVIHQKEFNLRCVRHLREGFFMDGDAEWVSRADAVIELLESDLDSTRKRTISPPRKRGK